MSWLPTIRIARAAWKGRQDPAGLLKAQLSGEQPPASLPAPAVAAVAPSGPAIGSATAAAAAAAEPVAQPHEHTAHTHLLLLLR